MVGRMGRRWEEREKRSVCSGCEVRRCMVWWLGKWLALWPGMVDGRRGGAMNMLGGEEPSLSVIRLESLLVSTGRGARAAGGEEEGRRRYDRERGLV